jgi:hypothetical protein
MKLKEVTVTKEMKVGLPNYSNITASCGLTFQMEEGEEPNWDEVWDTVNWQLSQQVEGTDPSWIKTGEYKNFFKVTAKVPKK